GICTTASAGSGLHLERLLYRRERGQLDQKEQPYPAWEIPPDHPAGGAPHADPDSRRIHDCRLPRPLRLPRRPPEGEERRGGQRGGCDYQAGMWVIGYEGDGQATNKEGQNFEVGLVPFLGAGRANWVSQTQERWLVTARGRLGLTGWGWFGDKTLLYVTGGGAWAKIDSSEFLVGAQTATG